MKRAYNPLVDLIQTLDDGIEFYEIAQTKSHSPALKAVFASMAEIREFALAYIRPYVDQHDFDLEKSLTYHGTLANRYAPLLKDIVHDESLNLVHQVEEHLIDAMIDASTRSHNALVQCILKDLAPRISYNFEKALNLTDHSIAA